MYLEHEEYSKHIIRQMIVNWDEVEQAGAVLFVVMRADMDMAFRYLTRQEMVTVNTMRSEGDRALTCGAVSRDDFGSIVGKLYRRLNQEGFTDEPERADYRRKEPGVSAPAGLRALPLHRV